MVPVAGSTHRPMVTHLSDEMATELALKARKGDKPAAESMQLMEEKGCTMPSPPSKASKQLPSGEYERPEGPVSEILNGVKGNTAS